MPNVAASERVLELCPPPQLRGTFVVGGARARSPMTIVRVRQVISRIPSAMETPKTKTTRRSFPGSREARRLTPPAPPDFRTTRSAGSVIWIGTCGSCPASDSKSLAIEGTVRAQGNSEPVSPRFVFRGAIFSYSGRVSGNVRVQRQERGMRQLRHCGAPTESNRPALPPANSNGKLLAKSKDRGGKYREKGCYITELISFDGGDEDEGWTLSNFA